jgi:hypothetical protein
MLTRTSSNLPNWKVSMDYEALWPRLNSSNFRMTGECIGEYLEGSVRGIIEVGLLSQQSPGRIR